jgi:small subunit ribosomal protein S1
MANKEEAADKAEETKDVAAEATTEETTEATAEAKESKEEVKEETKEVPAEEATPEVVAEETPAEEKAEPAVVAEEKIEVAAEAEEVVAEEVKEDSTAKKATKVEIPEDETPEKTYSEVPLNANVAPEDFDWGLHEAGIESYSAEEVVKYNGMYEGTLTSINEKEVVNGTVVSITKKEVVVNIGYKSEGVVPINEFRYNPELAVGDPVDLFIEKQEDKTGQLVVSHKRARTHRAWDKVNEVLKTGEVITGFVKCRTKGGLIADVFGIEAFLPGSQIDVKPIRDYDLYVGKNMEFKVVKINHEFRNVVVSHKALIEAELEQQKKQIIGTLEKGQVLEGTVKNITSYGVFIDLGGVDGLVHITDLSWGRVNHPEEIVELDQKLNVVILDFDDDKKRIALGLKQLQQHPWEGLSSGLKVGDPVKGKVVVLADYGAFVEIAPGVEGLIHVSEMSWSQHLRSAQDFLKIGDEVDAQVLTLDREERKMSLGIKQLMPDPWAEIETKYPIESKHTARVKNFTNFGVFVELEEGIDGLIHISDLSWSKKIKHPSEFCAVDDELDVVVLELDKEGRRLSLGHKQLEENPWDVFETVFIEGSVHQGTVMKLQDKTGIISLPYGVEGYAPAKHMSKADGSKVAADEVLEFKVLEFNKNAKKIIVSHTLTFQDEVEGGGAGAGSGGAKKKRSSGGGGASKAVKDLNASQEKTTLGDLDALTALKEKMEKGE